MPKSIRLLPAIILLTFLRSPVAAQSSQSQETLRNIGVQDSLYSNVLGENREYWIHFPGGQPLIPGREYPVIYLLDGDTHLIGLAAVQEYYNLFRIPEMIVVAISNSENRTRDLSPTEIDSRNGMAVQQSGGAARFTSFLADELIPAVDAKYPTTGHRVLVGHSFGGLFAVNTLLNRAELFTNYVALDPSLDWDENQWLRDALQSLSTSQFEGKGLFVSVSNEIIRFSDDLTVQTVDSDTTVFSQGIRSSLSFVRQLESNPPAGLRFDWAFYEDDIHGSVPLVGMRDAFVYLYDFWELKNPSLYNNSDTPTEKIVDLIRAQSESRSEGMGYPLPLEEELLEMLAFMSLESGQPDKARAVLALSAEYYPQSPAVHAALVDVCLSISDYECAETHARQADRLLGSEKHLGRVIEARNSN